MVTSLGRVHTDADGVGVLVVAGGLSHERDVSIRSGRRVEEALRSLGVDARIADVDAALLPSIRASRPDVVWPLLHGAEGEDGSLRHVLDMTGVPCVGSAAQSCRVAWDKATAKAVLRQEGLSTPEYVVLPQSLFRELGAAAVVELVLDSVSLPLVAKPVRGGSGLGVSVIDQASTLRGALVRAFSYDSSVLVERAVVGREVGVGVVEVDGQVTALPAVEVVVDGPYDYDARYNAGRAEYFAPARLAAGEMADVAAAALTVHRSLGLSGYSRVDFIVDGDGRPQFLEVSVSPGMTETSIFPQAVHAAGMELPEVCRDLVLTAVARG